jgi:hypothetical protein
MGRVGYPGQGVSRAGQGAWRRGGAGRFGFGTCCVGPGPSQAWIPPSCRPPPTPSSGLGASPTARVRQPSCTSALDLRGPRTCRLGGWRGWPRSRASWPLVVARFRQQRLHRELGRRLGRRFEFSVRPELGLRLGRSSDGCRSSWSIAQPAPPRSPAGCDCTMAPWSDNAAWIFQP